MRDDLPEFVEAEWLPVAPGTDVAVMLGLAHALVDEGRCDREFLVRYCGLRPLRGVSPGRGGRIGRDARVG
jgi:biotin/methionine sulfoxide reductase